MSFEPDPSATAHPTAPSPHPPVAPLSTPVSLTTGVSTTSVPTFMPPKPIMGGIIQTTEKDFIPWTGGRPLVDWTGLDPTSRTTPKSPNQQRPVSSSAAQKGHIYRQTGITTKKLSRADLDLPHFEERVWRHFCDTGLDTIAYVPNPIGSTEMINVIQEHDRFSVESVIKLVAAQVKKYDDYDIQSDDEATEFLKESLDFELAKELRDVQRPDDVFPVTFMRLIHLIRSTSSERYSKIKLRLQNRKPTMYPGQNLTMMASDMRADAKILETARQYEHSLTQLMLDNFLEAGGANNEDFRYPLRAVKVRLDAAILAIGYLDREAANQYMASEKLSYRDICDLASEGYRNQSDSARGWPPARGVQDNRTPPKAYGNAAIASVDPTTLAQAYVLLQTTPGAGGKAKPTDVCLNCGKTGHWARDCPQKKSDSKKSGPKSGARRVRGSHHGRQSKARLPPRPEDAWKTVKPAPGQPTTKKHDNKPFYWCEKCGRWTPTHTTATHKGPAKATDSVMPLQANFSFDTPSAWNFGLLTHRTWWSLFCEFFVMTVKMVLRSICNRSCLIFFSACLGFSLGKLPEGFWMFAWRLLTSHWSTFLPVIGWLSCLILSIFGHHLLFETPVDFFGRPMIKAWVPIGPIRRKQMIRRRRTQEKADLRSRQSGPRRAKPTHLGLRQKAAARPPIDDRHLLPLTSAINSLQNFAASISFERVGREGVGRNRNVFLDESLLLRQKRTNSPQTTSDRSTLSTDTTVLPQQKFTDPTNDENLENKIFTAAKIGGTMSNFFNYLTKPKIENYPVIWDSGASLSITPHVDDFDGPLDPTPFGVRIQGIAKGLVIAGVGRVVWSFPDAHGGIRTLKIPAYYVPKANVRLLSTNSLLQAFPTESIQHLHDKLILSGDKENNTRPIEISVDPRSNLHIGIAHDRSNDLGKAYTTTTSLHNENLSAAEKELLRWHCRLGHLNSKKIQFLMQSGVLAHSESARRLQTSASKLTSCPMCAACQYGKQKRTATPGRRISTIREREGALKQDDLFPGQKVSVDHFVCSTKGRLPNTYGKEDPKLQYSGGAIFVDHASGYTYIHHQVSLTTHATIESKEAFEAFCRDHGVVVSEYLSDNGTAFTSAAYRDHLLSFEQTTKFAGVGAHHHNGVAERAIQTIMSIARTMMLHSAIHWPDVANSNLWPLAVDHAVLLFNLMPNPETGLSPHDLFTKTRWRQSDFQNFHVWGCPVYVLDKTISDGKKLPRWKPRSSRQFYVGMSKKHASSVPMCLNLDTGAITPQFHVVFDEEFATVASNPVELPDFDSDAWRRLFGDSTYQYVLDDDDQSQQDHQPVESIPPP
jgi:GAG-pre-integrase domain/Zinc knuckle